MSGTWFVYGLIDPRTRLVFYVGQTRIGCRRPAAHGNDTNRTGPKGDVIADLHGSGLSYEWTPLEHTPPGDDGALHAAEVRWIAYGRGAGWPLTNLTTGGAGGPGRPVLPDEVRRDITFRFRCTPAEDALYQIAAAREDMTVSEWLRRSAELAIARGGTR